MNRDVIRSLPKVELHLHLEGAIPLATLWDLIQKYGGDPTVPNPQALAVRFRYVNFTNFLRTWFWKNGFLRDYSDFTQIAAGVAQSLVAQGVRYVELFYSPGDFARHGLTLGGLTEAIRRGLDREQARLKANLIVDLIRNCGPERGQRWLAEAHEVRNLGVVGIGIGGSEAQFPPEAYAQVYESARILGFHTTAHAGEAAGPASIRGAIDALKVERIGHATCVLQDPGLLERLRDIGVAVEACPISNLRTGVIQQLADHPIKRLLDAGVCVSVNTDDPTMFATSLDEELMALHGTFGFGYHEAQVLTQNAIDSAFCDGPTKARLRREVEQSYQRLRVPV